MTKLDNQEMHVNNSSSSLLNLPPELRLKIYKELAKNIGENITHGTRPRQSSPDLSRMAITKVCRLIREESIPIMYGELSWGANYMHAKKCKKLSWLEAVDPYALQCMESCNLIFPCVHFCDLFEAWGPHGSLDVRIQRGKLEYETFGADDEECCEGKVQAATMRDGFMRGIETGLEDDGSNMKETIFRLVRVMRRTF